MQEDLFGREPLRTNIVPFEGDLRSSICFFGEAPGEDEDLSVRPFVGSAGQLLMRCFKTVGLTRSEVILANIFRQRPPNNSIEYFFRDKKRENPTFEGLQHIEYLRRWLQELLRVRKDEGGCNLLVALGDVPLRVLTGRSGITKYRGSVLPCTLVEGFKVYASFHPSYVNRLMNEPREALLGEKKKRAQNVLPIFIMDLQRIIAEAETPKLEIPNRSIETITSLSRLAEVMKILNKAEAVAVDIETLPASTGPIVWCIGFSDQPNRAFVVPILRDFSFAWSKVQEELVWVEISKLFLNPKVSKIFQNGSYDLSILGRQYGLRVANKTYEDTMLCHQMLYPYLPKGLDFLASIYTKEPYYKDDGKVWDGRRISDAAEFIYNGKDCGVTREVMPIAAYNIRHRQMQKNYDRTIGVFPSILRMQIRGVRIDLDKRNELAKYFREKSATAAEELTKILGQELNINSPAQVNRVLYGTLNLPVKYNPKTGKATTDKDAINRLLREIGKDTQEHRVLELIKEQRESSKLSSTYMEMEIGYDGRIRTSYGWVSTFRLSSSESHFGGGGNLQNIPKRTEEGRLIRQLFIPDDGLVFMASDLMQAEAREVAWLSGDMHKMAMFLRGYDVHWYNAKLIFGIPDEIEYDPGFLWRDPITGEAHTLYIYRNIGKTIIHASNYKMGPRMLQTILIREGFYFPELTCKRLLSSVLANSPMLQGWHRKTIEEVKSHRRLMTALGDVREFRGRLNDELFRSAIAFRPQSVVGRILQIAIQDIHEKLDIYEPLLNVHDEVVGQCREKDLEEVKGRVKELMEIPHIVGGEELVIPADFKWGYNWGEMKEF